MKLIQCPQCKGAGIKFQGKTAICEYCGSTFLCDDDEIPAGIIPPEVNAEEHKLTVLKELALRPFVPADVFETGKFSYSAKLRKLAKCVYDPNLKYDFSSFDLTVDTDIVYHSVKLIYSGKTYFFDSYSVGRPSFNAWIYPDVTASLRQRAEAEAKAYPFFQRIKAKSELFDRYLGENKTALNEIKTRLDSGTLSVDSFFKE